jgi:hypothetical protein
MQAKHWVHQKAAAIALAVIITVGPVINVAPVQAQLPAKAAAPQNTTTRAIALDSDDIGGVVRSAKGPEAGVWVIAETKDLPTKFARIVVTDDLGRYVIPDLPKATYSVFVRGYGLVDSRPVTATPGKNLDLTAVIAPSPFAAAQYYPANYWLSMLKIPPKDTFPKGRFKTQQDMLNAIKGAILLQQVGDKASREIPEKLGKFKTTREAWEAWSKSGEFPARALGQMTPEELDIFAQWSDRIQAGEVPPPPPRPQGVERNLVITEWDWSDATGFIHDDISTDKNNPTVNANGLIYGVEQHTKDVIDVLDPNTGKASMIPFPVNDPSMPLSAAPFHWTKAPLTWGDKDVRIGKVSLHNPMFDQIGRLWMTVQFRAKEKQPDFCKEGSDHPSAKFFPLQRNAANGDADGRELSYFDPKTKQFTNVDVCFGTHHLEFANDSNHTLWTSGGEDVIGWVNTKVWDETHNAAKSQGWCPYVLDTNGNGKPDPGWVEPPQQQRGQFYGDTMGQVQPGKDLRIRGVTYGVTANSPDGSIWGAVQSDPGFILRTSPGTNPPYTCTTEIYKPPANSFAAGPKGVDVDRDTGLIWVAFAHSGTFASFDRKKCKVLNGPTATGEHCPEGWTFYPTPGPKFQGVNDPINTDYHYLDWVDQYNVLGLGKSVPFAPGTNSDSMIAFLPSEKKFVQFRIPYPLGFYARGVDGRIDDPNAGWKGRGLWSTYASIASWTYEGGKGTTSKVVKLQLRPDPLAK